jgi:predicted RNA-binding protein associated with RNAse of E/G family
VDTVRIVYRRPPDRVEVFEQTRVHQAGAYVVTYLARTPLRRPVEVEGRVVLEPGAPVVWFTYPGGWHDAGRFHLADGTFTGVYANVLTPVEMDGPRWETTDLFLDVWRGVDGLVRVLDHDELAAALRDGALSPALAARAAAEASTLEAAARAGTWPPPHVAEWTLERVRAVLAEGAGVGPER